MMFDQMTGWLWAAWILWSIAGVLWVVVWFGVLRYYGDEPLSRTVKRIAILEGIVCAAAITLIPLGPDPLPDWVRRTLTYMLPSFQILAALAVLIGGYAISSVGRSR